MYKAWIKYDSLSPSKSGLKGKKCIYIGCTRYRCSGWGPSSDRVNWIQGGAHPSTSMTKILTIILLSSELMFIFLCEIFLCNIILITIKGDHHSVHSFTFNTFHAFKIHVSLLFLLGSMKIKGKLDPTSSEILLLFQISGSVRITHGGSFS